MKKGIWVIILVVGGTILLSQSACKSSDLDALLVDVDWVLESIRYTGLNVIYIQEPFILFFHSSGEVTMTVDCNLCSGFYDVSGDDGISFTGEFSCTEVFCGPDSHDQKFLAALASASKYDIEGNRLTIYFDTGTLEFSAE